MHPEAAFQNNAQAEEWIYGHVLEHSGVRAARAGHKTERCVLCKKIVDGYRSREEHMRRCVVATPFLDTARDLEAYGVTVCAFDQRGEWTQVRVAATKDLVWVRDRAGKWVNPRALRIASL